MVSPTQGVLQVCSRQSLLVNKCLALLSTKGYRCHVNFLDWKLAMTLWLYILIFTILEFFTMGNSLSMSENVPCRRRFAQELTSISLGFQRGSSSNITSFSLESYVYNASWCIGLLWLRRAGKWRRLLQKNFMRPLTSSPSNWYLGS